MVSGAPPSAIWTAPPKQSPNLVVSVLHPTSAEIEQLEQSAQWGKEHYGLVLHPASQPKFIRDCGALNRRADRAAYDDAEESATAALAVFSGRIDRTKKPILHPSGTPIIRKSVRCGFGDLYDMSWDATIDNTETETDVRIIRNVDVKFSGLAVTAAHIEPSKYLFEAGPYVTDPAFPRSMDRRARHTTSPADPVVFATGTATLENALSAKLPLPELATESAVWRAGLVAQSLGFRPEAPQAVIVYPPPSNGRCCSPTPPPLPFSVAPRRYVGVILGMSRVAASRAAYPDPSTYTRIVPLSVSGLHRTWPVTAWESSPFSEAPSSAIRTTATVAIDAPSDIAILSIWFRRPSHQFSDADRASLVAALAPFNRGSFYDPRSTTEYEPPSISQGDGDASSIVVTYVLGSSHQRLETIISAAKVFRARTDSDAQVLFRVVRSDCEELERTAIAAAVAEAKQDADRMLANRDQKAKPTLSVATLIGPYLSAGSCQGPDIIEAPRFDPEDFKMSLDNIGITVLKLEATVGLQFDVRP